MGHIDVHILPAPRNGTPEQIATYHASVRAYNARCEELRKDCLATDHQWIRMSTIDAYPAQAGRVCMHCDLTDLCW